MCGRELWTATCVDVCVDVGVDVGVDVVRVVAVNSPPAYESRSKQAQLGSTTLLRGLGLAEVQ